MHRFEITENESEQRLDRFLLKYLDKTSRTNIFKLIRKKIIRVNGKKQQENYILNIGDILEIRLHENAVFEMMEEKVEEEPMLRHDLDIIFENDEILVINKPAGLLIHPDKNEYKKTLTTYVQHYLKSSWTKTFKPAAIQRLDKNTSGIVIFGKTYQSLKKYNEMMRKREIKKYYKCIVEGNIIESGEIKGYLAKDMDKNIVRLQSYKDDYYSKHVHTKYKPLEHKKGYTLLEVEILTGRSHQIRASLSYIGHPIVGDVKYNGKKIMGVTTQVLHAWRSCIEEKEFKCESPDLKNLWEKL